MKKMLIAIGLLASLVLAPLVSVPASAQISSGITAASTEELKNKSIDDLPKNIVNVLLWIIGIVSVVMIIWSGFNYIISHGDSGKVQKAKMTLVYAVVGLVIAVLSYTIVNFVLDRF